MKNSSVTSQKFGSLLAANPRNPIWCRRFLVFPRILTFGGLVHGEVLWNRL